MTKRATARAARPTPKEPSIGQAYFLALIRDARNKGWGLEDIGEHLDKSFSSVSRWANGVSTPHENDARRLAPVLERLLR